MGRAMPVGSEAARLLHSPQLLLQRRHQQLYLIVPDGRSPREADVVLRLYHGGTAIPAAAAAAPAARRCTRGGLLRAAALLHGFQGGELCFGLPDNMAGLI